MKAATILAVSLLWWRDPTTFQEHGLVENAQVMFLLLAAIVHGWRGGKTATVERGLRIGLALLCSSLAVREVDIDRLGDEAIMSSVEAIVRAALVVAWVFWGWRFRNVLETLWSQRAPIAFSALGLLVFVGTLLYGSSWPFDRYPRQFGGDKAIFAEQGLQLLATMTLFAASLAPRVPALAHRVRASAGGSSRG